MNGVSLKDIFNNRNGNNPDPSNQPENFVKEEEKQMVDSAKERVDSLFKTLNI